MYIYIYVYTASNFYDFHARAPAHLEIRFNSLNFKKLPPLPRRSALHPSWERVPPLVPPYPARSTVHATPTHHLDTLLTVERNCAALHRLGPTSPQTSLLVPWKHPCHDQESTLLWKRGRLAHLQECPYD